MNRLLGETLDDYSSWDTVYYYPPPEQNNKDNGVAMTFYTCYFNTSSCLLTMNEYHLRRHKEDLVYGILHMSSNPASLARYR
ncbi:unnamed protein product [Urochloa humidicola]